MHGYQTQKDNELMDPNQLIQEHLSTMPDGFEKAGRAIRAALSIKPNDLETEATQRFKVLKEATEFEVYHTPPTSPEPETDFNYIMWYAHTSMFIPQFGHAVISTEDIQWIAQLTGNKVLVEVGAGSGSLAHDCNRFGLNVIPTEPFPYGHPQAYPWIKSKHTIKYTGQEAVSIYSNHNLLYSWPEYGVQHPAEILDLFSGELVVYIGEPPGGSMANDDFHKILSDRFDLAGTKNINRFPCFYDSIFIHRRKK